MITDKHLEIMNTLFQEYALKIMYLEDYNLGLKLLNYKIVRGVK